MLKKVKKIFLIPLLIFSLVVPTIISIAVSNNNSRALAKVKKIKIKKGKKKYIFTQTKKKKIIALKSKNKKIAKAVKIKKKGEKKVYIKGIRVGTTTVSVHYKNKKGKKFIKNYYVTVTKKKATSTSSPSVTAEPEGTQTATQTIAPATSSSSPNVSEEPEATQTILPTASSAVTPDAAKTNNPDSPYYYRFKIINSGKYHLYTQQTIHYLLESNDPEFFNYSFGLINNDTGAYDYTSEIFKCNFYEDDGRVNLISYFDNLIADGDYYANNGKSLFYIYIKIPGTKIPVI
ncbi:MAG: hypothetical protein K6B41_03275, partial [Butyrivibrio sp.]|nr:hypothetical protein [Butyrivibrio sp.]